MGEFTIQCEEGEMKADLDCRRPVYVIGHRCNDTSDISKALSAGCNAIECDLLIGKNDEIFVVHGSNNWKMALGIALGALVVGIMMLIIGDFLVAWIGGSIALGSLGVLMFLRRLKTKWDGTRFDEWLDKAKEAKDKCVDQFALIVFDLKLAADYLKNKKRTEEKIEFIYKQVQWKLNQGGNKINVVYSIAKYENRGGFMKLIKDNLLPKNLKLKTLKVKVLKSKTLKQMIMQPNEILSIDQHKSAQDVERYFIKKKIKNGWYGYGIASFVPRLEMSLSILSIAMFMVILGLILLLILAQLSKLVFILISILALSTTTALVSVLRKNELRKYLELATATRDASNSPYGIKKVYVWTVAKKKTIRDYLLHVKVDGVMVNAKGTVRLRPNGGVKDALSIVSSSDEIRLATRADSPTKVHGRKDVY